MVALLAKIMQVLSRMILRAVYGPSALAIVGPPFTAGHGNTNRAELQAPFMGLLAVSGLSQFSEKPCKQGQEIVLRFLPTRRKRRAYQAKGP
jgi:hypothetical protein